MNSLSQSLALGKAMAVAIDGIQPYDLPMIIPVALNRIISCNTMSIRI
jgi:hypothetical protein